MRLARPVSKRLLGAVALHGLVDFAEEATLVAYPLCMCMPRRLATPAFALGSVWHFAEDVGLPASVLLHLALAALPPRVAMVLLDVFFVCVHLPLLLLRLRARPIAAALLMAGLAVGAAVPDRVCGGMMRGGEVVLNTVYLKVVAAHCLTGTLTRVSC